MHREKRKIETGKHQPKVQLAKAFAKHSASKLWRPIVKRTEEGKHRTTDQDIVKMSNDEVGVVNLQIDGDARLHNARHTSEYEDEKETERKQKRSFEDRPATPDRGNPTKYLNAGRNHNHQCCCSEKTLAKLRETGREHVVYPKAKTNKAGRDQREYKRGGSENLSANKG